MSSYYNKIKLSKKGELRDSGTLLAPKLSSSIRISTFLSSLFLFASSSAYAAIFLLPDVQNEEEQILSSSPTASIDAIRCEDIGYTYYESGTCPTYHNQSVCVFSDRYLKCDAKSWCLDNGYSKTSCTSPKIVSTKCPNGTELYKNCICPSTYKYYCTGTGYSSGSGTVCDSKYTSCNCSTNYTWNGSSCVCDSSFKYTCSGTGYSSGSGVSCGGKYKSCNCSTYYSWNGSACTHVHSYACPSGYSASSSGMVTPVNTPKTCKLNTCTSTSGTCYKETHTHSYSCPSGYSASCEYGTASSTSKVCSCGATSGSCYTCLTKCEADPCASGCYTNKSCSCGCKSRNSCGGCISCYSCSSSSSSSSGGGFSGSVHITIEQPYGEEL